MATARLSAYLRTIKSLSEQRYGEIRDVLTHATAASQIPETATKNGDDVTKTDESSAASSNLSGSPRDRQTIQRLVLLSCAVCGIELCYAAETAFVSPTLLRLGIPTVLASLTWCLSPLLGLVLGPVLGSLSDQCRSSLGRRRPFILLLSVGVVIGLILVPHGSRLGFTLEKIEESRAVGMSAFSTSSTARMSVTNTFGEMNATTSTPDESLTNWKNRIRRPSMMSPESNPGVLCCVPAQRLNASAARLRSNRRKLTTTTTRSRDNTITNETVLGGGGDNDRDVTIGTWQPTIGVVLTVIGVILLDCCCDACQSPCRTYLLDVIRPQDQAAGLATFTVMAGLGGSVGYFLGGVVDWKGTDVGRAFGGHIQFVFGVVTIVFVIFVMVTVCSVNEVPLDEINVAETSCRRHTVGVYKTFRNDDDDEDASDETVRVNKITADSQNTQELRNLSIGSDTKHEQVLLMTDISLKTYLLSIVNMPRVNMPRSLKMICLTNFFSWSSLVCYSLFFTDFVGQSVFEGDPRAPTESGLHRLYETGVRTGARRVYVSSQLVYTIGATLIALTRHHVTVIVLSICPGIMYATLFTMPYILVAHCHSTQTFEDEKLNETSRRQIRGLGTDIAVVSSMVFVAQFLVSAFMGAAIEFTGSSVVVMVAAAILSLFGALTAARITYPGI